MAEPVMAIGIAGMFFIVLGWALSLPAVPPLRLSTSYFIGSTLLTIYAILLRDPIFTVLNALATGLALANIFRGLKQRRKQGVLER